MRYQIVLKTVADACTFVNKISAYPFDVDLYYGHIILDAKSLMSVLHTGLNNPMKLCIHEDRTEEIEQDIRPYIYAS